MSQHMLLLYAPEPDEAEEARRWADLPAWARPLLGLGT